MPPQQPPYGGDYQSTPGPTASGSGPQPPAPAPGQYQPYQPPGQASQPTAPGGYGPPAGQPQPPHPPGQTIIPPPPPRPQSPYDFFLNPQTANKKAGLKVPFKQLSIGKQLAFIAGGGLLLVILLGIGTLFLPKGDPKVALIAVLQAQVESQRICDSGVQQAKLATNRDFAITCSLSALTQQRQLSAQLNKAGVKVSGGTLEAGRNAKNDQTLNSAKAANNYDEAFRQVSQLQLTTLADRIRQASQSSSTNAAERALLAKYDEATKLLLLQLKQD